MRGQLIVIVNNKEFGFGIFIRKENLLSLHNYSLYIKLLWFKFGIKICYGNKYKQWSNRN